MKRTSLDLVPSQRTDSFSLDSKSPENITRLFNQIVTEGAGVPTLIPSGGTTIALSPFSDQPGVLIVMPDEWGPSNRFYLTPATKLYVGRFKKLWLLKPSVVPDVATKSFHLVVAERPDQIEFGALPTSQLHAGAGLIQKSGLKTVSAVGAPAVATTVILAAQNGRRYATVRNVSNAGEEIYLTESSVAPAGGWASASADSGLIDIIPAGGRVERLEFDGALYAWASAATALAIAHGPY